MKKLQNVMKACLTFNDSLSDEIVVDNVVKQGDIFAPTFFSIYFLCSYNMPLRTGRQESP